MGSIFGAKIGMYFTNKVPDQIYGKIYALLLVVVIVSMAAN